MILGASEQSTLSLGGLQLALILVLFTFGGWNEMAYVAAEVRDPRRNIVRALVSGTVAVTVIYLLVNGAFLYTLFFFFVDGDMTFPRRDTVGRVPHERLATQQGSER